MLRLYLIVAGALALFILLPLPLLAALMIADLLKDITNVWRPMLDVMMTPEARSTAQALRSIYNPPYQLSADGHGTQRDGHAHYGSGWAAEGYDAGAVLRGVLLKLRMAGRPPVRHGVKR